ncbi:Flavonol reductase/cinnamoyl-CoA reductase family protein [Schizosaccharomyces pombe]|uniref:Putative uncharacterized oxidoreductase C513.07 n=1 Tax=Schizosaccharomyces pombe (strain 972 / ATCC 24843) TaxID=284812 RepID=YKJ7_SCHPO|nr:flavonol reductase/cinnamoyl-CoA reductase family [Schizosaccharomyces pombe]Q9UT59.1 RecName: Full=Putative uncharacterized oxidoreductase C513.07 [Schizosaccharomyces pombe 972h-]CAB58730.1 flavonol reductase/cinnamoyl-CoA reductase family [Schizosaccharomyces pombe]|eukprot:NP_593981.1 flavonol reductase/cinnamoyl-CoA reductase family [Schizosaccharomyces pombe]
MSGKLVLVTGVTGFIGAHVAEQLLQAGYRVRGTVRSMEKADELIRLNPGLKDKIEFVIVKDVSASNAFDGVLKDVELICHIASPFFVENVTDNKSQLLDPAVKGTLGILEAAQGVKSIKRIVITSSFAAVGNFQIDPHNNKVYTEKDWNPITYEEALTTDNGIVAYCASKKLAEEAAREYVKEKKPSYDICTINPPYVYGPPIHPMKNMDSLNTSNQIFWKLIDGSKEATPFYYYYVDVRDVAAAHVFALENAKLSNGRMLVSKGVFTTGDICKVLRKEFPNKSDVIAEPVDITVDPSFFKLDNSFSKSLGFKYHSDEECYVDTAKKLWERAEEFK